MMHFVLACILIGYAFWFGLQLKVKKESLVVNKSLKNFTWVLIVLLFIQLAFGALLAGHKGASSAPTWPDINGSFIPAYVFNQGLIGMVDNPIVIQFIHRSIAYLLVILILVWFFRTIKTNASPAFQKARWIPLILVLLQATLGVLAVLTSVWIRPAKWNIFEWMAQLHQLVAILLLLSLISGLYFLQGKQKAKTKNTIEATAI
jgi:cytochrome c oxidase assembly protein subunit 15